jgi:hydrogenase/urease accessory protein HupE
MQSRWFSQFGLLLAALMLLTQGASAHPVGLSRGDYTTSGEGLEVAFSFSERELLGLSEPSLGTVDMAVLARAVLQRVSVRGGEEPCAGRVVRTSKEAPDGVRLELSFACRSAHATRSVELRELLQALSRGHRHEARVTNGATTATQLLFGDKSAIQVAKIEASQGTRGDAGSRSWLNEAAGFVHMGVEHILLGFDHLVFLLGLVIVGLEKRRLLGVVTAFTLAHSLTLAAAVTGWWSPPSAVVEPAIALSIAYVGIENLIARSFERRTLIAFAFGLIHGFGFAGALGEASFEGSSLSLGLLTFNLGVELGQLAVLATLLPLIAVLRRRPSLFRRAIPVVNTAVVLLGMTWFVLRVV